MKLLSRLFGRKATQLTYDQIANLIDGSGGRSVAGYAVTDKTALQVATVFACVKAIADGCATPDLHVYREKDDGTSEKATNIPEYRLLSRRPNEWQTSFEWRRLMTMHAALTGAALSIKVRGDNRRVRELIPVMPGRWDVRKISRYEVRYRCWDEFGMIGEFTPDDVFVLNAVQWDWIGSLNAVSLARSAIGLAMAAEGSQVAMHENGLRPSGTYSVEGTLSKEQHDRLTAVLKEKSGSRNSGVPLVLDRAAKWLSNTMTGVDAQHVETRKLQIEEICRSYGVFPIMVGHSDKTSTFASSEAFFAAHLKHTLAPWHKAWRDRLDETLLDGSGPLYTDFDTRYLVAGSMVDRSQWARTMAELGIYTRNELRDEEGKDPLPGLDEPLTPLNMGGGKGQQPPVDPQVQKMFDIVEQLRAAVTALTTRQAPPPNISVTLNQDPVEVRMTSPAIEVRAATPAPAPVVHVHVPEGPAPVVNNTVNVPELSASPITVEAILPELHVQATMPARKSVSQTVVERNASGDIVKSSSTSTETDA